MAEETEPSFVMTPTGPKLIDPRTGEVLRKEDVKPPPPEIRDIEIPPEQLEQLKKLPPVKVQPDKTKPPIEIAATDVHILSQLTGEAQFEKAQELELVPEGAKYTGTVDGRITFLTKEQWQEQLDIPRQKMRISRELSAHKLNGGYDLAAALRAGVQPSVLKEAGFDPLAIVDAQSLAAEGKTYKVVQEEFETFKKEHIQLPDDQWMLKEDIALIAKESPELHKVLIKEGFTAYDKAFKALDAKFKAENVELADNQWIAKENFDNLAPKYQEIGETKGFEAMTKAVEEDQKLSPAELAKEIALDIIPVYGTYRYYERAKQDGWTAGEVAVMAGSVVADLLFFLPAIRFASTGARAAIGAGRGARVAGAARGLGKFAIAEVKAPITSILHPIATAKATAQPLKTILFPRHVPTAAAEVLSSTIRIPIKDISDVRTAMKLKAAATDAAIHGRSTFVEVSGAKAKITPAALVKMGEPVAIHSTPDIRPYLSGTVVKYGREGGLFVAPTMHTRFSEASAAGFAPVGGTKGALIFRDKKIIDALIHAPKTWKGTVEIEKKLGAGYRIPKPTQILYTTNSVGRKVTLLVFGKPYTATEIAKLKFIGTADTISQIFTPAVQVKGNKYREKVFDAAGELFNLDVTIDSLKLKAAKFRKIGKLPEAIETESEIQQLAKRIERLRNRIDTNAARYAHLDLATTTGVGILKRWQSATGRGRTTGRNTRQLADINMPRLGVDAPRQYTTPKTTRQVLANPRRNMPIETPERTPAISIVRPPVVEGPPSRPPPDIPITRIPPGEPPPRTPPEVPPPRIPLEPPPPRIPPDGPPPRVPPGEPPPRVPFGPPVPGEPPKPPVPVLPSVGEVKREEERLAKAKGIVTWRQGIVWWSIYPPYKTKADVRVTRVPPKGATVVKGVGSAYKTIQSLAGDAAILLTLDMGAFDVIIDKPKGRGKPGAIKFKRDVKKRTISDIELAGIRKS